MRIYAFVLTCFLTIFQSLSWAQDGDFDMAFNDVSVEVEQSHDVSEYPYLFPKLSLGFTPSALLNLCTGLQFSADFGVNEGRGNLNIEYAYIFADNYVSENSKDVPDSGFRLKMGYDKMIKGSSMSIGGGILLRNTNSGNVGEIDRGDYIEEVDYYLERDVKGLYGTLKWHRSINERMNMRVGMLLGMSSMKISRSKSIDEDYDLSDLLIRIWSNGVSELYQRPGTSVYPLLGFHLNFSYAITK